MTKDEALKLALEALKQIDEAMPFLVAKLAQASIKEALAQPEQEPVAWEQFYPDIGKPQIAFNSEVIGYVAPQRTWVGLTEEEQLNVFAELIAKPRSEYEVYKAYELALKEKNTLLKNNRRK